MKKIHDMIKTSLLFSLVTGSFLLISCEKYLDKAPAANVSEQDAFKDFISFQGFTEQLYAYVVDPQIIRYSSDYCLADDSYCSKTYFLGYYFDAGNYRSWESAYGSYFGINGGLVPADNQYKGSYYDSWTGIRAANVGLANLNKLGNATQEEKDLIKGQLLFFRGYFYHILMKDWGGLTYIDTVLQPAQPMKFPRLNYQQTALKAAADLEAAANLLPLNWDDLQAGQRTLGSNRERINKVMALSYAGKTLLYAASPLMNKESTGNAGYNAELCQKAAADFGKAIELCDQTDFYRLQPFATYSDVFFKTTATKDYPGGVECIFAQFVGNPWFGKGTMMWVVANIAGSGSNPDHLGVTANYVKNWGDNNGLPIDDPAANFNPADPWKNRDPRFYKTIVVDGDQVTNTNAAGLDQFIKLYTGGRHRISSTYNNTGFVNKKYWGLTCNNWEKGMDGGRYIFRTPLMRLADVYLMYSEAVLHGYGTPQSRLPGNITAEAAFNRVRTRAGMPNIAAKFTATKAAFMEEIIRERAVELSFEGHRWNDLRRWLLNGDPRFINKTELLFDRDPVTGRPINMVERTLVKRVVEEKHNWLPLPIKHTTLYPEFDQNPGW